MQFVKAGSTLHLDFDLDISIPQDCHLDEEHLKSLVEAVIRSYFDNPYMVDFSETGKL